MMDNDCHWSFMVAVVIVMCLMLYWLIQDNPLGKPLVTKWGVDRGWRPDWECDTQGEARAMAGNGRIYKYETRR